MGWSHVGPRRTMAPHSPAALGAALRGGQSPIEPLPPARPSPTAPQSCRLSPGCPWDRGKRGGCDGWPRAQGCQRGSCPGGCSRDGVAAPRGRRGRGRPRSWLHPATPGPDAHVSATPPPPPLRPLREATPGTGSGPARCAPPAPLTMVRAAAPGRPPVRSGEAALGRAQPRPLS